MAIVSIIDNITGGGSLQRGQNVPCAGAYIEQKNYNISTLKLTVHRNGRTLSEADWETALIDGDRLSIGNGKVDSGR